MEGLVVGIDKAFTVIDDAMGHKLVGFGVGFVLVGDKRGFFRLYGLLDKAQDGRALGIVGNFGPDFALALDGSHDGGFARSSTTAPVVLVLVARLAAEIGFVRLNDSLQQGPFVACHCRADTLLHVPCRFLV